MAVSLQRSSSRSAGRRRSTVQAGFSDINVTPFVDVMLVLLVIFMVTAPLLTVGVPVDLPRTRAAKMNTETEPLVISVDATGKSWLQETQLEGDALVERLIAVSGRNPDAKIYVRGDQKINYGRVICRLTCLFVLQLFPPQITVSLPHGFRSIHAKAAYIFYYFAFGRYYFSMGGLL
jgi:biopolymer transport protein TolR